MKKEFLDYLKSIGITTPPFIQRVEAIHDFFQAICQKDIVDIFVDDYMSEEGRRYSCITFFSDDHALSAHEFLTGDDFVIFSIRRELAVLEVEKADYDFKAATEKSRLLVRVESDGRKWGTWRATQQNCDNLRHILLKYFMPNLK